MKKLLLVLVVLCLTLIACSKTEDDITKVVFDNIKMSESENVAGYMATMHEESPAYKGTEEILGKIFANYDLKYELQDVKLIEKTDTEAKVKFVQITKKVSGPNFRDNKISGVHLLKKSGDKWKIYSTDIQNIEYLN